MDVNLNAELKSNSMPATPAVVQDEKARPSVQPVKAGSESSGASMDSDKLAGRQADERRREEKMSSEKLSEYVEEIQERFDAMGTKLGFSVSEEPDAVVVQVTDKDTGELIKQFPSEEVLALKAKLEDLVGLLFDQKV